MNSYNNILQKLSKFSRRYYGKVLVKGLLLFFAFGLLFFLVILGVEYFLWLNSTGRFVLLISFIAIELFLLFNYILTPLFYLLKIKRGISNKDASLLIGRHFPEVDDKLYNLLDLAEDKNRSELLVASIEQRADTLQPIPFVRAVDFRDNLKFVKYSFIPLALLAMIWIGGDISEFLGSTKRIVNYQMAYERPAPFSFKLLSNDLEVLNNESYTIEVTIDGDVRPDNVFINVEGKRLQLKKQNDSYQYVLSPPLKSIDFFFTANDVRSRKYRLEALVTPSIEKFELFLDFPSYVGRKKEVLKGTGNAVFPEGTKVTWKVDGKNAARVDLIAQDTSAIFDKKGNTFQLAKRVYADLSYELATSNRNVQNYERLSYNFDVVKDTYPSIKVNQVLDSLNPNVSYYVGEAADDYLVNEIRLVCYPEDDIKNQQVITLELPKSGFSRFYYTFPSGLQLKANIEYNFYFEAVDNDGIRNGKSSKSQVFTTKLLNADELKSRNLRAQDELISNMDRSLEKFKEQKKTLEEINNGQKEKQQLNFNDQSQIKDFLKKQQHQESMMQKFSKELKENLEKSEKDDGLNEFLKERLERQEIEAKKNEKLIEELKKIADKIEKDELTKRLEELGKKQQNSERNLEQLLELTKRYYVTEKASQLAKVLEKLAERQDELSDKDVGKDYKKEQQEKLNEDFNEVVKELDELREDNQNLKKPLNLNSDKSKEASVQEDQRKALEEINKNEGQEAVESQEKRESSKKAQMKQKSAAQKMKEMSEQLQQSSAGGGGGSSITEDAEMLRQILDNLITFSFKQENLFDSMEDSDLDISQFSGTIKKQKELRELFEHVDDSLFSLSLRRAEISEFVNEQITEVYYNTDKALESIAENQIYQGVSYQKYVLNASNELSDFLANLLDNMQESMQSGEGEGEGKGFQLPDIIRAQGELKERLKGEGKSGQGEPKQGKGQGEQGEGKKGKGEQAGQGGKSGTAEGEGGSSSEGQRGKKGDRGKGGVDAGQGQGEGGQNKRGLKDGQGSQNGPSEEELKEIYEIYKEQQLIRQRLDQQLKDLINSGDRKLGEKLIRQMEDFENDLLENGITEQGIQKMNTIEYELLKLENAAMRQGKKDERESNTNDSEFSNPIISKPSQLENYRNEIEILNRQALPLRQNFKSKVKQYFENDN